MFTTEFGMALLYFDQHTGGNDTLTTGILLQPSMPFPKNPFNVPEEVSNSVQDIIEYELSMLSTVF